MATKSKKKKSKKSSFFLNGPAFNPPPLNGLAFSGGFFFIAASLKHS
jgi:hypothetical protein